MPEIKNTFTQGKMNKDLDERIVPNGQYRDAMNIQVSTSEGADVGTVQNILGNTRVGSIVTSGYECVGSIADEKNDVIYSFVTNDINSAIIEYAKDETVTPVLVDVGNNVLKFSTGDIITGINIIDEFLLWTDGVSEPKKINIQRCIDGSSDLSTHTKLYLGPTTGGAIVVDASGIQVDITEEHITVIKKKPLRPLSVKINPADPSDKKPLFEKIFPRFSYRYRYEDGEYSAFAPFTDVVFNSEYSTDEYNNSPYTENTAYDVKEPYNSGMINMIDSIELYDFVSSDMPEDVIQIDILYKQENSTVVHVVEIIKNTDAEWGPNNGFNANSSYDGKFEVKSENIYAAVPTNQLLRPWDNVPKTALAQEVTGNRVVYGNYKQSYDLSTSPKVVSNYKLRYDGYKHEISYILDSEKIVNGLFNTDATIDWTLGSNITWQGATGNYYVYFAAVAQHEKMKQTVASEVGKTYVISFKAAGFVSGDKIDGKLVDGNGNYIAFNNITTSGVYEFEETMLTAVQGNYTALGSSWFNKFFIQVSSGSTFTGYIDEVSVREKVISSTVKTFLDGGFPSVKSQRNYQLGVVYGDKYGRETPVFTSSESSVVIPWEDTTSVTPISSTDLPLASFSLQLEASLNSDHPTNVNGDNTFDYYKFFVKETSGEYYNLVMDALYNPTKPDLQVEQHVWISFASSERNKISKDDYIILKKKFSKDGSPSTQILDENKFRVLDVQNEAPDAIKYKYESFGEVINDSDSYSSTSSPVTGILTATGYLNANILCVANNRPIIITGTNDEPTEIHVHIANWLLKEGVPLTVPVSATNGGYPIENLYFSFSKLITSNNQHSKKYKISSIRVSGDYYKIRLAQPITQEDSDLAEGSTSGDLDEKLSVRIERKFSKDLESFSGRFFVKIISNPLIKKELEEIDELGLLENYQVESTQSMFYHADAQDSNTSNITGGLINNSGEGDVPTTYNVNSVTGVGDLTSTETGWQALLTKMDAEGSRWFIDRMYMAGASMENKYAKSSGHGWYGGEPNAVLPLIYSTGTSPVTMPSSGYGLSPNSVSGVDAIYHPTQNVVKPQNPGTDNANLINGMEGIVTSNDSHVSPTGIRMWKSSTTTTALKTAPTPTIGNPLLHISFLAPGSDLHNGNWQSGRAIAASSAGVFWYSGVQSGKQCIQRELQGIYGGGIFTSDDGSTVSPMEIPIGGGIYIGGNGGGMGSWHNGGSGFPSSTTRNALHANQWDPTYPSDPNSEIQTFINNLELGNKFRFVDDTNGTVYKIKNISVNKVYNHTPWRKMWKDDGSGTLEGMNNSVEEAAIAYQYDDSGTWNGGSRTTLMNRIIAFGKANNRRLVYTLELDKDPTDASENGGYNPIADGEFNSVTPDSIEFLSSDFSLNSGEISQNPAIWETEPKDNVDLDIYYEAGQAYPITLTEENRELFAPVGCRIEFIENPKAINGVFIVTNPIYLQGWSEGANYQEVALSLNVNKYGGPQSATNPITYIGNRIRFFREDGSYTTATIKTTEEAKDFNGVNIDKYDKFGIEPLTETGLSWYNCFSFGNGVESDRIRDDFNGMTLTNGVRANATLDRPYEEEHRKSGMIYSGLYNSISGINNLNQFIMAEKITKDLNPTYGSIQKLFSRRISLIAFCEDRVVGITANKNALYNADGNPQLVATNAVLGDANPFVGDYGISKNPESFAKDSYRAYFTDKQRGAVLRLSMDGLTPISDSGMSDWFKDEFKKPGYNFIGSFDTYKNDYNLTLDDSTQAYPGSKTITYSEDVKGWTSFKSFIQESGVSMSGDYYTFRNGMCWKHDNEVRNTFYGAATDSSITFLFNESPTAIKNFNTLNYDGDENWICESITTDLQSGTVTEFIEKEGKWFNYIEGVDVFDPVTNALILDTSAFNFQGIGTASNITYNIP